MDGNPYAHIVSTRIEYQNTLLPLAVNSKLNPPDVIAIIRGTAEKTADGRRTLINA